MIPNSFKINFYAGDTETITIRWKQENNTPIDMTGCTAHFTIAKDLKEEPSHESLGVIDTSTGEVVFMFSAEATEALIGVDDFSRKTYVYDIEIRFPPDINNFSAITTILKGSLQVHESVTKMEV